MVGLTVVVGTGTRNIDDTGLTARQRCSADALQWVAGNLAYLADTAAEGEGGGGAGDDGRSCRKKEDYLIMQAAKHVLGNSVTIVLGGRAGGVQETLGGLGGRGGVRRVPAAGPRRFSGHLSRGALGRQATAGRRGRSGKRVVAEKDEYNYMIAVEVLTALVDAEFQAAAAEVAAETGGDINPAPPKGFMRMFGKLGVDHANEPTPRQCNIDCSRNCISYATPTKMLRGFEALSRCCGSKEQLPARVQRRATHVARLVQVSRGTCERAVRSGAERARRLADDLGPAGRAARGEGGAGQAAAFLTQPRRAG
jgi:hypothetical protein